MILTVKKYPIVMTHVFVSVYARTIVYKTKNAIITINKHAKIQAAERLLNFAGLLFHTMRTLLIQVIIA